MKRILLLQWLLLATVMAMAQSQDPQTQLTTLQANFDQFARNNPQERVYLHFDNTSYYKGEHIYYKAYVVDDATLKPSDMSRILYVELVNPIGYPVETQKLMVRNGQTSGSFLLKDTLNAGFYEVRAYTAWMLNFAQGNGHGWWRMTKVMSREFYGELSITFVAMRASSVACSPSMREWARGSMTRNVCPACPSLPPRWSTRRRTSC